MNKDTCAEELDVAQVIENLREVVEQLRGSNRKLLRMLIERDQRIADLERRYDKVIGWLAERNMLVADLEKQLGVSQPAANVRLPAMALEAWEL